MGPGSWGWVAAALDSTTLLGRPGALESIDIPVLTLAASEDRLVSFPAIRRAAVRLPHGELVIFGPEAFHELLRECDAVRDRALEAIDFFLDRAVP